jgi:general secretion pathway protein M
MSRLNTLMASPRTSRILALALLALLVLIVIAAIAAPTWFLYQRYHTQESKMTRQFSSYTALNQMRPKMMQAVEVLKARDTKKYFLKGTTPGLAGADLQDVVKALIESNSGKVFSTQLLPHKDDNGYRQVSANIQMSANIQNLRQILHAIESREPYLNIDNISIRSQVPSGFKLQPGVEPDMFIQFDVSGMTPLIVAAAPTSAVTAKTAPAPAAARTEAKP